MNKILILAVALFSTVALADRRGTEGVTQSFDSVEYDQAWGAALSALEDKTIETAIKDVGQITTKAVKSANFIGDKSTTCSVKIGQSKPIKITVHVNVEMTVTSSGRLSRSQTDTHSDDDAEKEIMKKIEDALKPSVKTTVEAKK